MSLHVPTMFVALLLAFVLFGVALASARSSLRDQAELRLWGLGTWLLVAGFVALAGRAVVPEWVSVLCGNGLVFASVYVMSQALHRFLAPQEATSWQATLGLASLLVTALILGLPLHQRTAIVSTLLAAQLIPLVVLVVRRGWHAEPSLRTVAITFALAAGALFVRAGHALVHPEEYTSFFQASFGNGLTYLASFLFPLGAGFGFVLANLERLARGLDALATYDALTGCTNRGVFEALLQQSLGRCHREGIPVSLIVMDLDLFKQVNDIHGHQAGDTVLRAFAGALRDRLRTADGFGRLGGEEFGVILSGAGSAGAMRVAEDLRATIETLEIRIADATTLRVTVSLGVSTAERGREPKAEEFFAEADKALYGAKRSGRNRVVRHVAE